MGHKLISIFAVALISLGCSDDTCEDKYPEVCRMLFKDKYSSHEKRISIMCNEPVNCIGRSDAAAECLNHWRWHKFEIEVCPLSADRCYGKVDHVFMQVSTERYQNQCHTAYKKATNQLLTAHTWRVPGFVTAEDPQFLGKPLFYDKYGDDVSLQPSQNYRQSEHFTQVEIAKDFLGNFLSSLYKFFDVPRALPQFRSCQPQCKEGEKTIPHITDCRSYYVCRDSVPIQHECPLGRFYNPKYKVCLYFEEHCVIDYAAYQHCRYNEL